MANLTMSAEEMTSLLSTFIATPDAPVFQGPAIVSRRSDVRFAVDQVSPPAALYIGPDDVLRFSLWGFLANTHVRFLGRYLRPDGQVGLFSREIISNATMNRQTVFLDLGECFLLNIQIAPVGPVTQEGSLYVSVDVGQSTGSTYLPLTALIQDYVMAGYNPSWPGGHFREAVDGPGLFYNAGVSDPGAGLQWVQVVPTNTRWLIESVRARLTTNGVAGAREPEIQLTDELGNVVARMATPVAVPAATNAQMTWFRGGDAYANPSGLRIHGPLPNLTLAAGSNISSLVTGMDAGDAWHSIAIYVQQWIEPTT